MGFSYIFVPIYLLYLTRLLGLVQRRGSLGSELAQRRPFDWFFGQSGAGDCWHLALSGGDLFG